jgi:predicted MFS family arabinose efflux permease
MVFAMYRLAQNVGTTVAPLIGVMLAAVSFPLLFWTEACAAAGCALIGWRALGGEAAQPRSSPAGAAPRPPYRAMLRDVRFMLFLLGMLLYAAVYIEYVAVVPLAVRAAGWSMSLYGVLLAVNGLIVISCELLVTTKVRHWPRRVTVFGGMALVAAGMTAYAIPLGPAGFITATVIWSAGEILGTPTLVASPVQAAGDSRLVSSYVGASQVAFGIGSALGPVAGVALWNGIRGGAWLVFGIAGLLAATVATAGIPRADRDRQESTREAGGDNDP